MQLSFIGHVTLEDLERGGKDIAELLADWPPGMRLLGDLERLQSMDDDCVAELGKNMELFDRNGVELVVRVIPGSTKDIGLNILMIFHYKKQPRVVTCSKMTEAARILSL